MLRRGQDIWLPPKDLPRWTPDQGEVQPGCFPEGGTTCRGPENCNRSIIGFCNSQLAEPLQEDTEEGAGGASPFLKGCCLGFTQKAVQCQVE